MNGGPYLVTGAGGFIGSALCRRLREHGRVLALTRKPEDGPWEETVIADLEKSKIPADKFEGVDTVFHLAAKTHSLTAASNEDEAYESLNVGGTAKLLGACRAAGVRRFVFFSSVKAIGEGGPECADETTPPRPTTAYGITKLAAEKLVLEGGYVPEGMVLRLALVYGPGAKGNLTNMIETISRGAFPPIPKVANRRTMIHVDDVVSAAVLAASSDLSKGRIFIVTDGKSYATSDIYEWITEALGKSVPAWRMPVFAFRALAKTGDVIGRVTGNRWKFDTNAFEKLFGSAFYDSAAIREKLGFVPKWDLKSALPAMVETLIKR